MAKLLGALTANLAPLFDDSKALRASKNWLAFMGQGGGSVQFNPDVDEVQYEIVRGKRKMATLIKRTDVTSKLLGTNQKNKDFGSSTQVSRAFPLSIEEYNIPANRLRQRIPGESNLDSGVTRQDRMMYWAAKGQNALMNMQVELMNVLVAQGLLTGKQDSIIGTTIESEKYDFYRKATHIKTLGTPWKSNPSTCTPLADFDVACSALIADGNMPAEFALCGQDVIPALLKSTEVKTIADNRVYSAFIGMAPGETVPAKYKYITDAGWECRGRITTLVGRTLYLFTTEALSPTGSDGALEPSMPVAKVLLGNTNSRIDAQFGGPETYDEDAQVIADYQNWFGFAPGVAPASMPSVTGGLIRPEMFYLDAIRNEARTATTIRSQCAPLFVPVETDTWYTMVNAGA
jgi:hypothetical protein